MGSEKQKTISSTCELNGVGLHLGQNVNMKFFPGEEDQGIIFKLKKTDGEFVNIPASGKLLKDKILRTAIGYDDGAVETVEHVLAAASGLGLTNLTIEMDSPEPAACDGCALEFTETLENAGIIEQEKNSEEYVIKKPISVYCEEGGSITAVPHSSGLKVSYTLAGEGLPEQHVEYTHNLENFKKYIAPSRTFCREADIEHLQKLPEVGKGATEANTLVVNLSNLEEKQKFENELAYHKVLDLLGDLSLFGKIVRGHLICHQSGHKCNHLLLKALRKESNDVELNINRIKDILPHSYPFLLVDKILEYEENKRVVGLKNVTINEHFFQGHFPDEPIMPGVLLIEALAQTGAVFIYRYHGDGKLVLFTGVDKVKFRHRVIPGDQVILEVDAIHMKPNGGVVKGVAKVDGAIACQAEMKFMIVKKGI